MLLPDIPREYTQITSLAFIVGGLLLLLTSPSPFLGVGCIGFSCWVLMMSESVLHNKIQVEMSNALEGLRQAQASEIQDLLFFLREMKKSMTPFESLESAKSTINRLTHHPSIILDPAGVIIDVNKEWCSAFGWSKEEIVGKLHLQLHDPDLYSAYAMGIAEKYEDGKNWLWSRMIFKCKDGSLIKASVGIVFLGTKNNPVGTLGLILPDVGGIIENV